MNKTRLFFIFIFSLFLLEIFLFSPQINKELFSNILWNSLTWDSKKLDFSIICIFNSLGLIPIVIGCYLIPERQRFNLKVWPFFIASFFFGAGSILPYLIFRKEIIHQESQTKEVPKTLKSLIFIKFMKGLLLFLIALLVFLGFFYGNYSIYIELFKQSKLVHVMTIDFLILMFIILPYLIFTESSN